jgi:hypothetical protein
MSEGKKQNTAHVDVDTFGGPFTFGAWRKPEEHRENARKQIAERKDTQCASSVDPHSRYKIYRDDRSISSADRNKSNKTHNCNQTTYVRIIQYTPVYEQTAIRSIAHTIECIHNHCLQ